MDNYPSTDPSPEDVPAQQMRTIELGWLMCGRHSRQPALDQIKAPIEALSPCHESKTIPFCAIRKAHITDHEGQTSACIDLLTP